LHLRTPRIAENAPRSERARTELHPSIEPSNDVLFGEQRRKTFVQILAFEANVGRADALQKLLDDSVAELRPQVRDLHGIASLTHLPRLMGMSMPDQLCGRPG